MVMTEKTSWTQEKSASIDWTDPVDILSNHFTFLDIVSFHPALAEFYYSTSPGNSCTLSSTTSNHHNSDREQREGNDLQGEENPKVVERKKLKDLFLHHSSLEEAILYKLSFSKRRENNENENAPAQNHTSVLDPSIGLTCSKTAEKIQILMKWAQQGFFTLRSSRWCRRCGAEGHTVKSCLHLKPQLKGVGDTLQSPLLSQNATTPHVGTRIREREKGKEGDPTILNPSPPSMPLSVCSSRAFSGLSFSSVLEKHRAHQLRLEKKRLLEEKMSKMGQQDQRSGHGSITSRSADNGTAFSSSSLTSNNRSRSALGSSGNGAFPIRGGNPYGFTKNNRELELFSDERCRGVVNKLEPQHNIGFVRTSGSSGNNISGISGNTDGEDYKFFIDRCDCGVKLLEIGTRVTFKIDKGRDLPIAVDVRAESPVINAEDVKMLIRRCRVAGVGGTHTIEILTMLVSHVQEWQDVLRHFYYNWSTWRGQQIEEPLARSHQNGESSSGTLQPSSPLPSSFLNSPGSPALPFPSHRKVSPLDCLPSWIYQVQAIVELTTFYTNREPIHHNILESFLLLLVTPISVSMMSPLHPSATPDFRSPLSASPSSPVASRSPTSTTATSFSFMKDLFPCFLTFWQNEVAAASLSSCFSSFVGEKVVSDYPPSEAADSFSLSNEKNLEEEEKQERWVAAVADTLCESADLIVLIHQNTGERKECSQYLIKSCTGLQETLQGLWGYANARVTAHHRRATAQTGVMARAARRLHTGFTRLRSIASSCPEDEQGTRCPSSFSLVPSISSSVIPMVSLFPTAEELAIPPPYVGSVFHPSRLPVYFTAEKTSKPSRAITTAEKEHQQDENLTGENLTIASPSSPYDSTEAFILSHCQLLRADTFESTARVLSAVCFDRKAYPPSEDTLSDAAHAALYDQVRFMGRVLPRDRDYAHPTGYLFQVQPKSSQASLTQRLHPGTCVCFVTALSTEWVTSANTAAATTTGNTDTSSLYHPSASPPPALQEENLPVSSHEIFWGTISSCDAVLLQAGIICVEPCVAPSSDPAPPPPFFQLVANLSRNAAQNRLDRCLMLETSIFFAGYASIMNSLKAFLGPFAMPLPQSKRLRGPGRENTDPLPKLIASSSGLPRPLLPYIPLQCSQAFLRIIGSVRKSFPLDKGQEQVMLSLPYEDILLVQGPPGTGKSFIGCRVVETYVRYKQMVESGDILQHLSIAELGAERILHQGALSASSSVAGQGGNGGIREEDYPLPTSLSPVVIITYKNHALDEFLVDLLDSKLWGTGEMPVLETPSRAAGSDAHIFPGGARLIRIGGRSKESRLAPYNLSSLMREWENKSAVTRYREHIGILHQRLDRLTKEIKYLEQGRVPKSYFEKWLTPEQRKHIQFEDKDEWLVGGRYLGSATGATLTVDRNYYKTLLQSSLGAALEKAEFREKLKEDSHIGGSTAVPIGVKRERSGDDGNSRDDTVQSSGEDGNKGTNNNDEVGTEEGNEKLSESEKGQLNHTEQNMEETAEGEEIEENGGNEEIVRSVFQEMRKEEELREYNNRLHLTALSPEAIYLAHHPPRELPSGIPSSLQSLWSLDPLTRHQYYAFLIQKTISEKAMQCFQIMARISNFLTIRNHAVEMTRLSVLQSADVVGLTTTGCAMHQGLLRSLRPRVLVVEEAAEVLESQLLACMTDSLQQIILIGDHFQLQPKVETFGYEKVNHMNLSLFERLAGHIPVIRLTEQRRMHPALSQLIRPYYSDQELIDHFSLLTRPLLNAACHPCVDHVPGLAKRVFFWKHQYPEEQAPGGSRSKVNPQEVQMVYQVVSHIVEQGLMQRSITVITPYLGQRRLLRRHLRLSQLGDVRVSTVDLFQGDESDVIVLSLVRTGNLTEFLKTRNRLVVSCSRARFAMVMIGNDELLQKCDHWATLLQKLHELRCVGESLPVTVEIGREKATEDGTGMSEFSSNAIRRKVRYLLPKHLNKKE